MRAAPSSPSPVAGACNYAFQIPVPGLSEQNAAAHVHRGEAGVDQNVGGLLYICRIGRRLASRSHRFVPHNVIRSLMLSGASEDRTSAGNSNTTGPGEPERRVVKARRIIIGSPAPAQGYRI